MRTLKWNGERWYIDERSLWKRCRQWLIWIGGWEKPNGTGWRFRNSYDRSIFMPPFPISLLGHLFTFFGWGWQMKLCKLYPFKVYRYVTWSKRSGFYISNDGTPPDIGRNEGVFLYRKKYRRKRT
jgi:hypothetical protein